MVLGCHHSGLLMSPLPLVPIVPSPMKRAALQLATTRSWSAKETWSCPGAGKLQAGIANLWVLFPSLKNETSGALCNEEEAQPRQEGPPVATPCQTSSNAGNGGTCAAGEEETAQPRQEGPPVAPPR